MLKKKKKTSCYKHFHENYYPVWSQLRPGAEDKINRQHMKALKKKKGKKLGH